MTTTELLDLHPFAPEVVGDPYGWYERLRSEHSVVHLRNPDLFVVTGYEEITEVFRNPAVYSSELGYHAMGRGYLKGGTDDSEMFGVDMTAVRQLISTDPPDHTRIRRLLSRAFTPRAINELEPRLREVCAEMIDELVANARNGKADLMRDLAIPFPVTVIAELLDIPVERRDDFRRWSDVMADGMTGEASEEELTASGLELFTFMSEVVEQRAAKPGSDLISRLVAGTEEGEHGEEPLTLEEITMIAILLLAAGNETTTNLMGNGFNALAKHPEQAEKVWSDPSLVPNFVEEVLRWESPVQCMPRGTKEATTLAGVEIPQHSMMLMCFGAANRDPRKFPDPDRFDITRGATDHLAFGHGIHFCLGASLARNEARFAFEALIAAGIEIKPSPDAVRTNSLYLRGFKSFPLVTN
jgi:cytochrome P450